MNRAIQSHSRIAACHGVRLRRLAACAAMAAALLGVVSVSIAQTVRVVEFEHDGVFDNGIQFLTAYASEIGALDAGVTPGWRRSRFEFMAYDTPGADRVPVCRFYGPRTGSVGRHFYTAFPEECEALKSSNDWIYEGHVFYVPMPDAHGTCAAGTVPMYRGYRVRHRYVQGQPGGPYIPVPEGPQHRLAPAPPPQGHYDGYGAWSPEGPSGVAFCVPASFDVVRARLTSLATGEWEFRIGEEGRYGGLPSAPLRVTFGPPAEGPHWANWYDGEVVANQESAMIGQWGDQPVRGWARWRPLEGKVVVEVLKSISVSIGQYYFVLSFDYAGGASIRGTAFAHADCGLDVCPDLSRRYVLVGERR